MIKSLFRTGCYLPLLVLLLGNPQAAVAAENNIIAVNIALDPDMATIEYTESTNQALRESYPDGFALDATHAPHITILQRYIKVEDLDKVIAAVDKVNVGETITNWRLTTKRFNFSPWDKVFLTSIVLEDNIDLLKLQQRLIDAIALYSWKTGNATAFFTTPSEPGISPVTVDYVTTFVPERTGKNYLPHITLGFASPEYKNALATQPFQTITFSPASLSLYQIGDFGTARKKLKEWR